MTDNDALVERLEGLMRRSQAEGAGTSDRFAFRSQAEADLPTLLSALRTLKAENERLTKELAQCRKMAAGFLAHL